METGDTVTLPMGTATPALVRPNTLLPPEKEPVNFQINLIGAPPEVEQLIEHIKAVAEQFLYHWKTFPINLPTPLSTSPGGGVGNGGGGGGGGTVGRIGVASNNNTTSTNRKSRPINLRDLFIAPPFDELDAVAADGTGEPRLLNNSQLRSLRERGEFEVPSLNFPGQMHRWRLSQLLQKGSERTRDSLLGDLAMSARFLVISAVDRKSVV